MNGIIKMIEQTAPGYKTYAAAALLLAVAIFLAMHGQPIAAANAFAQSLGLFGLRAAMNETPSNNATS
jgi:hypothetical protein